MGMGKAYFSDLLKALRRNADEFNPILEEFIEQNIDDRSLVRKTLYGIKTIGERERPFLVRLATQLMGDNFQKTLPIALGIELFNGSSLVADDLLDRANIRGGRPTIWVKWGDRDVLLVSESLHTLAIRALLSAKSKLSENKSTEPLVMEKANRAFGNLITGQYKCFHLPPIDKFNERSCIALTFARTGGLFVCCFELPALLCGVEDKIVNAMKRFGRSFGIAFQLRDDIIDIIGEEEVIGKPVCGDLWYGQPNIVIVHAVHHCKGPARRMLLDLWGSGCPQPEAIPAVVRVSFESGSLKYAKELVEYHIAKALSAIKTMNVDSNKNLLIKFAELLKDFGEEL